MGRASAVLSARGAAFAVLAVALGAYYTFAESLWNLSLWSEVAVLTFVVIPPVFALVYLMLPLWRAHGLLPVGLAIAVLAAALEVAQRDTLANFAKLAAATLLAFWFLSYFETAAWVVLVAAIVPVVDAISVWRGPTKHIVTEQPQIFTTLSFAFRVPGEHSSANLGLPDLLFFALFLAATVRFRLRTGWTWLAMTFSFGTTIAFAVWFDVQGLPALPLLSLGFLAPNADLLWKRLRQKGAWGQRSPRSARSGRK